MISVGILTYKRVDDISSTISELIETGSEFPIELIIVDNNPLSMKEEIFDNVDFPEKWRLIYDCNGINKGVAGGRNRIVELATSDICIFLDDDITSINASLIVNEVENEFGNDSGLGAIAFKIVDSKTKNINFYEFPHKDKSKINKGDFYTTYFIGAGHAIRTSCFRSLGGYLDNHCMYGMEEVNLSYRLINKGYKIKYCSDISIVHKRSPDGRFSNSEVVYSSFLNKCMIAAKYMKFRYFITHMLAWSFQYIRKTNSIKRVLTTLFFIIKTRITISRQQQFGSVFYEYSKHCNAWLWW